jgi:hypothetical protein
MTKTIKQTLDEELDEMAGKLLKEQRVIKVVINRCYGGFDLSSVALKLLAASSCKHVKRYTAKEYYGGVNWQERLDKDKKEKDGLISVCIVRNKIITQNHDDAERTCSDLIAVVEKLGVKANSSFSSLKVIEIPAGVSYVIDEYDGIESIHEQHRTWG